MSSRKNPENKPLRIVSTGKSKLASVEAYAQMLNNMLLAQALLVKAGKSSALPHFIAVVKELESLFGFKFEILPEQDNEKA